MWFHVSRVGYHIFNKTFSNYNKGIRILPSAGCRAILLYFLFKFHVMEYKMRFKYYKTIYYTQYKTTQWCFSESAILQLKIVAVISNWNVVFICMKGSACPDWLGGGRSLPGVSHATCHSDQEEAKVWG